MLGIRKATSADAPALMELLGRLHGESSYRDLPITPAKLRKFVDAVLTQPSQVCFVHLAADQSIDGFVMGYLTTPFFSDQVIAYDIALYLVPERRGGIAAVRLFKSLREWAKSNGARQLWIGTSAGIDPERAKRFYLGLGLEEIGGVFRIAP